MERELTEQLETLLGSLGDYMEFLDSIPWDYVGTEEFYDLALKAQSILQDAWDNIYWLTQLAIKEGY